jgi:hypothetical protein
MVLVQLEQGFELLAEEAAPGRIIVAQGGQGIDHAVGAHVIPIAGFHTNDGEDDFPGDAVGLLCTGQGVGVGVSEFHAFLYPALLQENFLVGGPGMGVLRRASDGLEDLGLALRAPQNVSHSRFVLPLGNQFCNQGFRLFTLQVVVVFRAGVFGLGRQGGEGQSGGHKG